MNFRKKLGIIILASALVVAAVLLFYPFSKPGTKNSQGNKAAAKAQPFKLEKDSQKIGTNLEFLAFKSEANLTDKIASDISQKILDLNQTNDLSGGMLSVPNEDLLSQELIDKYKNEFWSSFQSVGIEDLKIIPDKIPQTSLDYLKNIFQIIYDNKITDDLLMGAIAGFSDTQKEDYLAGPIQSLDKAILEFERLSVPTSWAYLHRDLINLNLAKKEILSSFYSSQSDPLRALIAAELVDEINSRSSTWNNYVAQKLQKDNIIFEFSH